MTNRFDQMSSRLWTRKPTRIVIAIASTTALPSPGAGVADAAGWLSVPTHDFSVAPDSFSGHGPVSGNVLRNDRGATAVVRHTDPSNGAETVSADGTFSYTPNVGFTG